MNRQPERTERTRQALTDAFWQLYCEKKIEKITVKEIVSLAGYYRSTFYEYFSDVYDLLRQVEEQLLEDFRSAGRRAFLSGSVEELIENVLQFYETNGERLAILMGPGGDPMFAGNAKALIKKEMCCRIGQDVTELQTDLKIDLMASTTMTMVNFWYQRRDQVTLREVFRAGWQQLHCGMQQGENWMKRLLEAKQNGNSAACSRDETVDAFPAAAQNGQ